MGKPDPDKNRSIKLRMNTESEKEMVMSKLPNLKNAEDHLKKISVTDDYTVEERPEIRKCVEKAKEKTREDNSKFVWKARALAL